MIYVAIIDTYVKVPKENGKRVKHYKIKKDKVIKDKKYYCGKIINHGCICYQILYENSKDIDYSLHCIKVIDDKEKIGSIKNLIIALEWCLENNIQIISMSVGTRNIADGERLSSIVHRLYENGSIIVAAFNNDNTLTYPAAFEDVIGVYLDKKETLPLNSYAYLENSDKNLDIIARYNLINVEKRMGIKIKEYNSYIVPFIVSIILRMKENDGKVTSKNVREYLRNAVKIKSLI